MSRAGLQCLVVAAAALALTACTPKPPSTTVTASPQPGPTAVFTLVDGVEHDVCGLGLVVKFLPATAQSSTADYAVVLYGPIGQVDDQVQDHTGDQPLPANAVHPQQGVVVTLEGKRFGVNSIDPTNASIQLTALCS